MFAAAATYVIQVGREAEAIALFKSLGERTRAEPGNKLYLVHRSLRDARRFFLYEQYKDRRAFDKHCAADYFEELVIRGLRTMIDERESETYVLLEN